MIKNLTIENFQSHKHTSLDFHPGVNVILGLSDVGKSSILRALNWVAFNNPSGDFFRSDFTKKDTNVSVTFDSEDTVVRRRGKDNCYLVNDQKFKALGSKVPDEVSDLFNMDNVNMQPQWQSYFMLDQSSGQVARSLNAVSGLEDMDLSLKVVNSRIKDSNSEVTHLSEEIKECEDEIENLSWIDKSFEKLEGLKNLQEEIATKKYEKNVLLDLLIAYDELIHDKKQLPDAAALPVIESLLELDREIDSYVCQADDLQQLVDRYEDMKAQLAELDFIPEAEKEFNLCQSIYAQIIKDSDKRNKLSESVEELNGLKADMKDAEEYTEKCKKVVNLRHSEIDVCPTCNREWDDTCSVGGAV